MSTESKLLKRLRISVLMVSVLALVTFAYSGGSTAAADSMAENGSALPQARRKKIQSHRHQTPSLPARRFIRKLARCAMAKAGTPTAQP
jgi:hypothetical protein